MGGTNPTFFARKKSANEIYLTISTKFTVEQQAHWDCGTRCEHQEELLLYAHPHYLLQNINQL